MSQLRDLYEEEYIALLKSGLMWEVYPEATGSYDKDCVKKRQKDEQLKKHAFEIRHIACKLKGRTFTSEESEDLIETVESLLIQIKSSTRD